jgi:hypothetical protein
MPACIARFWWRPNHQKSEFVMRKSLLLLLAALAALLLAPLTASAQTTPVTVSFDGLEPLGASSVYEGWLIIDGAPQSTGTFDVDADENMVNAKTRAVENAESATAYVLTIEPANDPDPAPAPTHLLAGDFTDGIASLTVGHPAALGTDFSQAAGEYILATPTTATDDDNLSGVWFLDPTGASGPAASLRVPTLPDGWSYEGWVVIDGTPVSTGRFADVAAADDFNGFSGPDAGPPFPGEDFVANAPAGLSFPTDLSGRTVVISVEPAPDDSPAPFALKPLVGQVPSDVQPATPQALGLGPVAVSGTATLTTAATGSGDAASSSDDAASGEPQELAFTGTETWILAAGAVMLIAAGSAFVMTSRRHA